MRRVLIGDLLALANWIDDQPKGGWPLQCETVLDRVHAADKFRRRYGRVYADWGDGSIMAYVRARHTVPALGVGKSRDEFAALEFAVGHLRRWRVSRLHSSHRFEPRG